MSISKKWLLFSLILLGFSACTKKEIVDDPVGVDSTQIEADVNKWIHDQMSIWYFWNEEMPSSPDFSANPTNFFNSLLYKKGQANGDRFSWIVEDAEVLKAELGGESVTTGMEFQLWRLSEETNELVAAVLYTLPNSPAANAGFKRGDLFISIDGQKLTTENYNTLLSGSGEKTYGLGKIDKEAQTVLPSNVERSVASAEVQEDPVYFDTIIVQSNRKIGYLVYHQFIPGPFGSTNNSYDDAMDDVFATFKGQGVNELVLDLRYNGGGYVSSATNLASLIGKGVNENTVFTYKEYNNVLTPVLEEEYGSDFFADKFLKKTQNIGGSLSRVFVLVSGGTASASELVINGLKPFMPVVVVGDTTYGKNVGSVTLDDSTGEIKYGLQPIVTKSFNKDRESEYGGGFAPDYPARESAVLYPYGDLRDPLLKSAVSVITGDENARKAAEEPLLKPQGMRISNTISRKAGGSNMFETFPK